MPDMSAGGSVTADAVPVGTSAAPVIAGGTVSEVIDLSGATMLPGIIDPHSHIMSDAGLSIPDAQQLAFDHGYTTLGDASVEPDLLETFRLA